MMASFASRTRPCLCSDSAIVRQQKRFLLLSAESYQPAGASCGSLSSGGGARADSTQQWPRGYLREMHAQEQSSLNGLTPRELEVLSQIATTLVISEGT